MPHMSNACDVKRLDARMHALLDVLLDMPAPTDVQVNKGVKKLGETW